VEGEKFTVWATAGVLASSSRLTTSMKRLLPPFSDTRSPSVLGASQLCHQSIARVMVTAFL
jgi:hypothetical protein